MSQGDGLSDTARRLQEQVPALLPRIHPPVSVLRLSSALAHPQLQNQRYTRLTTRCVTSFQICCDSCAESVTQMSWVGGRLAALIAEGQRALGKEVVVMSEAQEDEEDDGGEDWVEEDDGHSIASSTRTGRRRWNVSPPPYSASRRGSPFPSASPRRSTFDLAPSYTPSMTRSVQSSPRRMGRDASVESDFFASRSFHEDENQWQTPELREAMERARARYRRDHA